MAGTSAPVSYAGVEDVINTFYSTLQNPSTNAQLEEFGISLLFSIAAMLVVYNALKMMLEGSSGRKVMAEAMSIVIMSSFALLLIKDDFQIKEKLVQSVEKIANTVSPGTSSENGFQKAYAGVFPIFRAINDIWAAEAPKEVGVGNNIPRESTVYTDAATGISYGGDSGANSETAATHNPSSIWNALSIIAGPGLAIFLLGILLKFIAIGLLMIAGIAALTQFLASQVLIYIAFILAPIFVPFLIWDKASFLFDGWLKFLIKATFHKVVGLVMIGLLGTTIAKATAVMEQTQASDWMDAQAIRVSTLVAIVLISSVIAYMMWQVGSIADGLLSGSARQGYRFSGVPKMPSIPKPGKKDPTKETTTTSQSFNKDGSLASTTKTTQRSGPSGGFVKSVTTDSSGAVTRTSESSTGFAKRK